MILAGLTQDILDQGIEALSIESNKLYMHMYFVWGRKKAE